MCLLSPVLLSVSQLFHAHYRNNLFWWRINLHQCLHFVSLQQTCIKLPLFLLFISPRFSFIFFSKLFGTAFLFGLGVPQHYTVIKQWWRWIFYIQFVLFNFILAVSTVTVTRVVCHSGSHIFPITGCIHSYIVCRPISLRIMQLVIAYPKLYFLGIYCLKMTQH